SLSAVGHVGAGTQRSGVAGPGVAQSSLIKRLAKRTVGRLAMPLMRAASRSYVAGERFDQALDVARLLQGRGSAVCIGYWNNDADSSDQIAAEYAKAFQPLSEQSPAGYLSIKL